MKCERQNKFQYKNHVYFTGVAIDGNNNEVKERHIQLVKKRGNVKALDEELYSKWRTCRVRSKYSLGCLRSCHPCSIGD